MIHTNLSVADKMVDFLFLAPVVITSQTHQPVGTALPYQVTQSPGLVQNPYNQTTVVLTSQTPYPPPAGFSVPSNVAPYPNVQQPMYPPAPVQQPMYPSAPNQQPMYPPESSQLPPTYNEAVNQAYEKQPGFNPNFPNNGPH
jgi:hypothetical protein